MNTKKKLGLAMTLLGGTGAAFILAYLGNIYIVGTALRYAVFIATFVAGVSLLVWGYSDLRTHQKNPSKKHNKVYDTPNNQHTH